MFLRSRRPRALLVGLLGAVLLVLACSVAQIGTQRHVLQRLNQSLIQADMALHDINQQVGYTLLALDALKPAPNLCSTALYADIAQQVAAHRFIYEAAIRRTDGTACSSYGRETTQLPSRNDRPYYPANGFDYWFWTGPATSADAGFIIVAQGQNYVWLNKGIVFSALGLEAGARFDLVDPQRWEAVFSSAQPPLDFTHLPALGALSWNPQTVQYALPSQWPGLISVVTLPRSAEQARWWGLFALTLGGGILLPLALFAGLRWARRRYRSIIPKLQHALKHDQLRLHYQPIVNLHSGTWVGMESLLRWPGSGLSPADFLPAAERAGLSGDLTRWVVRRVAEDYSQYLWACSGLYITINLTAQDVEDESFADEVREVLQTYQVPAHLILFEVTEGALVHHEKAQVQLQRLREQGHRIALDDFGTGYSSLAYLAELPVDVLKIDRSFLPLAKMQTDDGLWRHIVRMAHALNLTVVAEGVEQAEQAELLKREGVQFAQGWLYAKALPPEVLAKQYFQVRPPA